MKRVLIIGGVCALAVYYIVVYIGVSTFEPSHDSPIYGEAWRVRTMVIDPGHGGKKPGAAYGDNQHEKGFTLEYAESLRAHLEETGKYNVVLTREHDVDLSLTAMVEVAKRHRADAFLSIHGNSGSPEKSGYMVICSERSPAARESLKLAQSMGRVLRNHGFQQPDPGSLLLAPFWPLESWFEGLATGGSASYHYKDKRHGVFVNMEVKEITVLDANPRPAILIEVGYLTNKAEEERMTEPEFKQRFCRAVELGLADYFEAEAAEAR